MTAKRRHDDPQISAEEGALNQLPLWQDAVRGLPNPIARSSLFTVGNRNEPREFYRTHKTIETLSGCSISYKGEELRQDDEDVFLQLTHLARLHPLGDRVEFTPNSFLKELKWVNSSEGYDRLRRVLDRLEGGGLRVKSTHGRGGGFQGSLVRKFTWRDEASGVFSKWVIWLEPEIVALFSKDGYTQVLWNQRLRLKSSLAKYLHGYLSSHEHPFPIKVRTLRTLTGSRAGRIVDFRRALKIALDRLVAEKFLDHWLIDANDLVHVTRSA